jgi:hypothetical protein
MPSRPNGFRSSVGGRGSSGVEGADTALEIELYPDSAAEEWKRLFTLLMQMESALAEAHEAHTFHGLPPLTQLDRMRADVSSFRRRVDAAFQNAFGQERAQHSE